MVSLSKNQSVSLAKTAGSALSTIAIGLGWDPIKKKAGFLAACLADQILLIWMRHAYCLMRKATRLILYGSSN
ncbi:tellurium resistance protein TerD [Photobacterium aphoticum]|uniref:Tellurium resistance protein TerD n=1 Tax=Photobacterium aphoticum TaxID=754436 RepID=A0A090R8K0_9GAMM|nr:tellurium resistance protein TerD [Photobacterium aphoticum]